MQCQIVTGGAGFIGSCYVLMARQSGIRVITLDKLTYCGNLDNLASLRDDKDHIFVQGDIGDHDLVLSLMQQHKPDAVINFAAESHVDRSIKDPDSFVRSNVLGTTSLLRATLAWWQSLSADGRKNFRFLHVSTDEVFGSLGPQDPAFTETTPYSPNSPYSASKAASDHFVRAFYETYGLPVLLTNCSNNYGPRQFPEKLVPLTIVNALKGVPLPIYGTGGNIRDWLHVEDHCRAIALVAAKAAVGSSYNIGGNAEHTNIAVVRSICRILDELRPLMKLHPENSCKNYEEKIEFVADRPGHDWRYAMNCSRIKADLGWEPAYSFEDGLRQTVLWYLENSEWVERVQSGEYRNWLADNYGSR